MAEYLACVSPSVLPKHTWKNNPQGSPLSEVVTVIEPINLVDQRLPSLSLSQFTDGSEAVNEATAALHGA